MELLNRYLQAVKFWLPRAQQDDIITELGDDIRSQVEERESGLGRKLTDAEMEAILKERGRPLLVAGRYLPQRSLIGPLFFPAYVFVLKLVLVCYLAPWVLVWIGMMVFDPAFRAHHSGLGVMPDLFSLIWIHALTVFTVVTIVFAVLDLAMNKTKFLSDWTPRKLPPVRDHDRIPRASSAFEVVMGGFFGIWWLSMLWTLTVIDTESLRVTLAPAWHHFFWIFLPLWAVNTGLSAANFFRPYWTRSRRLVHAATNFVSAGVLMAVVKIQPAVLVSFGSIKVSQVAEVSINLSLAISFAIATLVCVIVGCVDVWRAYSISKGAPRLNHGMAV
jgi:hypothetical protein